MFFVHFGIDHGPKDRIPRLNFERFGMWWRDKKKINLQTIVKTLNSPQALTKMKFLNHFCKGDQVSKLVKGQTRTTNNRK